VQSWQCTQAQPVVGTEEGDSRTFDVMVGYVDMRVYFERKCECAELNWEISFSLMIRSSRLGWFIHVEHKEDDAD